MKQLLFILFFFLLQQTNVAQTDPVFEKEDFDIGEKMISGANIRALSYTFSKNIYNYYVDTLSSNIYIELRKWKKTGIHAPNGLLHAFDMNTMAWKWQKRVKYNWMEVPFDGVSYGGNFVMHKNLSKYDVLDPATGKTRYEFKRDLQYIFPELNLGLGYVTVLDFPNTLEGFELHSGRLLWRRIIPRDEIWDEVIAENDTTLLISSKGLHSINLNTSIGWSSEVETMPGYDNSHLAISVTASLMLGLFTGVYFIPLHTGMSAIPANDSKILVDEARYYVASNQLITALDKQGNELWRTHLPIRKISRTKFFKIDDNIILLNFKSNDLERDLRRSFVASFHARTGILNYISYLRNESHDDYLQDFELKDNHMDILYPDRIETIDIRDGKMVFAKSLGDTKFSFFVGEDIYVSDDSSMISLSKKYTSYKYVYTLSGSIVAYDENYNRLREYPRDAYYFLVFEFPGGRIVQNSKETIVLDQKNKERSRLWFHENFSVVNDHLYFFDKDKFFSVGLKDLIKD